jgi:hypothetical protein
MAQPIKPWPSVAYSQRHHAWYNALRRRAHRHLFTVYTKDDSCKRGEYLEEIDVLADTKTQAQRIATTVLQHEYEDGLRASRTVVLQFNVYACDLTPKRTLEAKATQ